MNRIFVLLGHASVRFRFLIVAAWIVVTIVAVQNLPSLASVAKDTTSGFLPPTCRACRPRPLPHRSRIPALPRPR